MSCEDCRTCACTSRTCVFGVYDGGTYGALERVSDHLAELLPASAPAAAVAHCCQARDRGGRSNRAADRVRRQ